MRHHTRCTIIRQDDTQVGRHEVGVGFSPDDLPSVKLPIGIGLGGKGLRTVDYEAAGPIVGNIGQALHLHETGSRRQHLYLEVDVLHIFKVGHDTSTGIHHQRHHLRRRIWCHRIGIQLPVGEGPPFNRRGGQIKVAIKELGGCRIGAQHESFQCDGSRPDRFNREHQGLRRNRLTKVRHDRDVSCDLDGDDAVLDVRNDQVAGHHFPIKEFSPLTFLLGFEGNGYAREIPSREGHHGRGDVNGIQFYLTTSVDEQGQVDGLHIVASFHALQHRVIATLVNEVVDLLNVGCPLVVITTPTVDVALHLGLDHHDHTVEDGVHVVAGEMRVAQVGPSVDVGGPESLVLHEGVEHRDVSLTAHITHVLRIAGVSSGAGIWQARVVRTVPEGVVQVPEGVAPAPSVPIGIAPPPPGRVPVQPVGTDHVAVQDEVVDQRHLVQLTDRLLVVRLDRHVVVRDEVDQGIPVRTIAVLFPCATPGLQEIDVIALLVVILAGEVAVVHLFTVFVDPPVLTVDVDDAAFARALIHMELSELTQRLAISVPDMATTGRRVVVIGGGLEDEALELPPILQVEQLCIDHIVIPHLISGDVVPSLLGVGIGIVSMLIGIPLGFHPERAVLMKELDVHRLVTKPGAILQTVPAHAHHRHRVAVIAEEVGVGFREAGSQHTAGIHNQRPHHRRLEQPDGGRVGDAHVRGLVAVKREVDLHARRSADVQGEGIGVIPGRLAHHRHGSVPVVHGSG